MYGSALYFTLNTTNSLQKLCGFIFTSYERCGDGPAAEELLHLHDIGVYLCVYQPPSLPRLWLVEHSDLNIFTKLSWKVWIVLIFYLPKIRDHKVILVSEIDYKSRFYSLLPF